MSLARQLDRGVKENILVKVERIEGFRFTAIITGRRQGIILQYPRGSAAQFSTQDLERSILVVSRCRRKCVVLESAEPTYPLTSPQDAWYLLA